MSFSLPLRYLPETTEEDLQALAPEVVLHYSTRAKRFALRVDSAKGHVKLVIPKRANLKAAYQFLKENLDWVEQRRETLPDPIAFQDGVTLPVFGEDRVLDIYYDNQRKTTQIKLDGPYIHVHTNKEDPSSRVTRFLKEQARLKFSEIAFDKAARINKKITKISIRDTSSRWGSCTEDGHISLSWRLLFAPYEVMDYVIAHEVAHLEHMNHSADFWELCEELCENYEQGRPWLRKNSNELMRYGAKDS